jgi:hypothetical protein
MNYCCSLLFPTLSWIYDGTRSCCKVYSQSEYLTWCAIFDFYPISESSGFSRNDESVFPLWNDGLWMSVMLCQSAKIFIHTYTTSAIARHRRPVRLIVVKRLDQTDYRPTLLNPHTLLSTSPRPKALCEWSILILAQNCGFCHRTLLTCALLNAICALMISPNLKTRVGPTFSALWNGFEGRQPLDSIQHNRSRCRQTLIDRLTSTCLVAWSSDLKSAILAGQINSSRCAGDGRWFLMRNKCLLRPF